MDPSTPGTLNVYTEPDGLVIDTHGAGVIDDVWRLLEAAYRRAGVLPTCLERDFNFPPLAELGLEVAQIARLQAQAGATRAAA